ncbi:MAG: J domain-containing protein [Bacteroidetes bacterium]|nr:J domain-containing protein [Bacteroidota bacterium]
MEFIDYYKILEIPKTASESEIKVAYRKLARKYHPDLNPNNQEAEKKFKELNEANEVLSDPEKRKKYDQYGKDWKHAEEFEKQKQSARNSNQQQQSTSDFSDFFESMYGAGSGRSSRQAKYRGQDMNAELHFSLIDVYKSHQQTLSLNGQSIRLTIPAGVENGQVIKISGRGGTGVNGGPNGDLYITFSIVNNTKFKREGANLYTNIDIDLYTALLGGQIVADSFDGKVKLNVLPETQSGTKIKLKGKGFPIYKKDSEFGDLYITYQIKLPTHLSEKEKQLFEELKAIRNNGN